MSLYYILFPIAELSGARHVISGGSLSQGPVVVTHSPPTYMQEGVMHLKIPTKRASLTTGGCSLWMHGTLMYVRSSMPVSSTWGSLTPPVACEHIHVCMYVYTPVYTLNVC